MHLADILSRIESRLKVVGLTARAASLAAGKPDAIRNLKRAVQSGQRQGVSTATLVALAPVLQTTVEWLLTGKAGEGEAVAGEIAADDSLRIVEAVDALAWAFQALVAAPEIEARVLARAVIRAVQPLENQRGETISKQDKRARVEMAIQLFRSE